MKHPCPYSVPLVDHLLREVSTRCVNGRVLDPMAGSGFLLDDLDLLGLDAIGVDLDVDWSSSIRVIRGDARALPFPDNTFGATVVSPTYANRLADRDMRPSVACTYMKALQREASPGSSCHMQWGPKYRALHEITWAEVWRTLVPGGAFVLNVKDHYRGDVLQRVVEWHHQTVMALPFTHERRLQIECTGNKRGANRKRVEYEEINVYRKAA